MTSKAKLRFTSCGSINSPIGPVSVYERDGKIVYLEMVYNQAPNDRRSPVVDSALAQLEKYFEGKLNNFDVPVQLDGTEFQRQVWVEIASIPFGHTLSYADIAARIGKPKAARAVGGAVGSNPVALIVGCHRVMGASNRITGYSGGEGISTKRWLLAHERIASAD
jgi:methylated-DNA-[protein]-cysteine S-methyltransferase